MALAAVPVSMDVKHLLEEYGLELDDVRWYLSYHNASRLLEYKENHTELCRLIWSGKLEADLYRMEDRYLSELQEKLDSRKTDESEVMKIFAEIDALKSKRE
jgi:hypothetical protein